MTCRNEAAGGVLTAKQAPAGAAGDSEAPVEATDPGKDARLCRCIIAWARNCHTERLLAEAGCVAARLEADRSLHFVDTPIPGATLYWVKTVRTGG